MVDFVVLTLVVGLPIAYWALTRSVVRLVLGVGLLFAVTGALAQTLVTFQVPITLPVLQWLAVIDLALLTAYGVIQRRRGVARAALPVRRQFLTVLLPALLIGALFLVLRLIASPDPGPLAGVGFLVSHFGIEDSAKWMNLAAQMESSRTLDFVGGYAGGPLLILLALGATLMRVLSTLMLGGVNEVAVVVGTFITSTFLVAVLSPFALAPFAESRIPHRAGATAPRRLVPAPMVWAGTLVLASAATVLIGWGHLSLQLTLLMLVLWLATFLAKPAVPHARSIATVIAACTGIVWFPLTLLGLALIAALVVWGLVRITRSARDRTAPPWAAIGLAIAAVIAFVQPLWASALFVFGGSGVSAAGDGSGGTGLHGVAATALRGLRVPTAITELYQAGGGTEEPTALVAGLAIAAFVGAIVALARGRVTQRRVLVAASPAFALFAYAAAIALADAALTGNGQSYATLKMTFAMTIVIASACLPLALTLLDPRASGMTITRWAAVAGVVVLLVADSLLPRAIAAVGPSHWQPPKEGSAPYFTAFEVRSTPDQPLSSLPAACVYLPTGAKVPSSQPKGEISYTCTRLLIGMAGNEGKVGSLMDWIKADWYGNGSYWNEWYDNLVNSPADILRRQVVLLGTNDKVNGFETLQGLLRRFPKQVEAAQ